MAQTLGMPSATPSNATGRSGISADQVGHIGQGILGTIEEGVGGPSSRSLYYGTGAAFYQAPSMQRSYGDDIRSFNVKTFGSRGMVNLARRWFSQRSEIYMTYPIKYAWAGPEYTIRMQPKSTLANTLRTFPNNLVATTGITTATEAASGFYGSLLGEVATEVRGGPNILPTYFWSGGVGFAMMSMIELNMGGGGNIIFDRYTNFAMLMASCPTISMRQDLMRMAGGGLYYDHQTDYRTLPVKFGWVPALTDEGTAINRDLANAATSENGENLNMLWAPVEWQITVPLKTPETNFWNALLSRKPIDTSCFASDLQYIITLGNFFEFSDTGVGLSNCPYYIPPLGIAVAPSAVAFDVIQSTPLWHPCQPNNALPSAFAGAVYTNKTCDRWLVHTAPSGAVTGLIDGTSIGLYVGASGSPAGGPVHCWPVPAMLPEGWFYTGFSPQYDFPMYTNALAASNPPFISNTWNATIESAPNTIAYTISKFAPRNRIAANPYIWGNHYRVSGGFMYGGYGKPRPRMAVAGSGNPEADSRYKLDVMSVNSGAPVPISYPQSLLQMEVRNHSLKLTNPALSAQQALKVDPNGSVYYPFQYGFSQTYRVAPASNPWDAQNFHRWNSAMALLSATSATGQTPFSVFNDVTGVGNKITQNIIMPANPCTSMIVGIYREKDRKFLGMNTQGSYSPVLFWNALNPAKCTLYDGGNILFDYQSSCAFENYSIMDRPDVFRIPFRGGLCQLDPKNVYGSPYDKFSGVSCREGAFPNGLNVLGGVPRRYQQGYFGQSSDGSRFNPLHCTEWYNCHLLEFPFCVHEPLAREGTVQSTPSFAKTILRLEFYIDCLLKPHRGLDDMYDQTTMVPPYWFTGEYDYVHSGGKSYGTGVASTSNVLPYGPLSFSNTTVATANVALSVPCCHIEDSVLHFNAYADAREQIVQSTRANTKVTNSYFTISPSASSWNINDGGLMIAVHFLQNQVWSISPLRTSILSSRG